MEVEICWLIHRGPLELWKHVVLMDLAKSLSKWHEYLEQSTSTRSWVGASDGDL
jgi:hypothetical protein